MTPDIELDYKRTKYECPESASTIEIITNPNGNNTETCITLKYGQFPGTKVERISDGIKITIIGTFEIVEFISALSKHIFPIAHHRWTSKIKLKGEK